MSICSSYTLNLGDDALITKCIAEGTQSKRDNEGKIKVMYLEHSQGVIMLYKNNSEDLGLDEELTFDVL